MHSYLLGFFGQKRTIKLHVLGRGRPRKMINQTADLIEGHINQSFYPTATDRPVSTKSFYTSPAVSNIYLFNQKIDGLWNETVHELHTSQLAQKQPRPQVPFQNKSPP